MILCEMCECLSECLDGKVCASEAVFHFEVVLCAFLLSEGQHFGWPSFFLIVIGAGLTSVVFNLMTKLSSHSGTEK